MARGNPARIAWSVTKRLLRGNAFGLATQLAYNFLFALFPLLICLVALTPFLPVHGQLDRLLEEARPFLPSSSYRLLAQQLSAVLTHRHGGLLGVGLAAALWSASSGVTALMSGLNEAYGVRETRPFWKVRGLALLLTVGGSLALLLSATIVVLGGRVGRRLSEAIGLPSLYSSAWSVFRWPVTAIILILVLDVFYHFCPNTRRRFRFLSPGSIAGSLLWLASALGFTFYVNHFGNYNAMYGSLATVIVLLTWLYVTGLVLLVGGEIDAAYDSSA